MKRVAIALLMVSASASAQPAEPTPPSPPPVETEQTARAKSLYVEGKRYYDVADYDKAIEVWKQAYVMANAPMLLFNIGQAYRLKGDCTNAMRFYSNFEREGGTSDRTELEQAKARCNPQPTEATPPATYPKQSGAGAIDLREPPRAVTYVDKGASYRTAGLVTGIGGAFLVGAGIYFGERARSDAKKVEDFRGEWTQTQSELEHSGQRAAMWSAITLGTGGAAVVGGALLYYLGVQRQHVEVAIHPGGAELTWAASF
jgi:hypothetical protein